MVVRKHKTTATKQRGKRTHGHGNTKNRRGAGNRGGRGRAGSQKHKFSKYYTTFGIKVRQNPQPKGKTLNVGMLDNYIENWVKNQKVVEEDNMFTLDGKKIGYSKLLGSGNVNRSYYVRRMQVSEKARTKIEEANGEIEEPFESVSGETKVDHPDAGEGDNA